MDSRTQTLRLISPHLVCCLPNPLAFLLCPSWLPAVDRICCIDPLTGLDCTVGEHFSFVLPGLPGTHVLVTETF